jgi:hypothetical protein
VTDKATYHPTTRKHRQQQGDNGGGTRALRQALSNNNKSLAGMFVVVEMMSASRGLGDVRYNTNAAIQSAAALTMVEQNFQKWQNRGNKNVQR